MSLSLQAIESGRRISSLLHQGTLNTTVGSWHIEGKVAKTSETAPTELHLAHDERLTFFVANCMLHIFLVRGTEKVVSLVFNPQNEHGIGLNDNGTQIHPDYFSSWRNIITTAFLHLDTTLKKTASSVQTN